MVCAAKTEERRSGFRRLLVVPLPDVQEGLAIIDALRCDVNQAGALVLTPMCSSLSS